MTTPKFVQRVARLPELLAALSAFPAGLSLRDLADRFDTDPEIIEQDLTSLHELESWGWTFDIFRTSVIEFAQPEDSSAAPSESTVVRLTGDGSPRLGVEHISPGDLAMIYTAGVALLETDPNDAHLDEALAVIAETMYGAPGPEQHVGTWNPFLPALQDAVEHGRRCRIVYSRAWREGVLERVIDPLCLVQTRRGWEVDAGPVGPEGNLRTYLLSNVRELEVLDKTFDPPSHLDIRLAEQRSTTTVRMELAQDARWAADMYAEQVDVVREDEETFEADLELLPPADDRVALLVLASGPSSRLLEPARLLPEALDTVRELIRHHSE
jgi:proteasome accessory factor C